MRLSKLFFVLAVAAVPLSALARHLPVIVNYDNLAITRPSGKGIEAEQVKQAIVKAATAKGWTIDRLEADKLLTSFTVKDKHRTAVEITYAADKYSIKYSSSVNLKYRVVDGQEVIHPAYNHWVGELKDAIDAELLKL